MLAALQSNDRAGLHQHPEASLRLKGAQKSPEAHNGFRDFGIYRQQHKAASPDSSTSGQCHHRTTHSTTTTQGLKTTTDTDNKKQTQTRRQTRPTTTRQTGTTPDRQDRQGSRKNKCDQIAAKACLFCNLLATEISSTYGSALSNQCSPLEFPSFAGLRQIRVLLKITFLSCKNAHINTMLRHLEAVFLHRTAEHVRQI